MPASMISTRSFLTCLLIGFVGLASLVRGDDASGSPPSAVGPLMKLFQSGRLPAERQGTVVEMICSRGNEHDLRVVFDKIVQPEAFPAELRLKAMAWLADAAETRKVRPTGDLSALEPLVIGGTGEGEALQEAAIKLASTWKDATVGPALQKLAASDQVPADLRTSAIDGLIAIGDAPSRRALEQLVGAGPAIAIRMRAAGGLAGLDLTVAAHAAAAILAEATPSDDPGAMLEAFLNRKQGPEALAAALAKVTLKVDVAKRSLRYIYSVGRSDQALSDVLGKAAGIETDAPPPTPEEVARIVTDVAAKGDPARGEQIFRRKDLNCMKCHSVSRAGGQVGPELSAVGGSSPVDYVVNSILNPNLAIKEQFATRVFVLANGKVLTGIVSDRDDVRIRMRDANGQLVTIPTADIEEELEGKSLMPQGLTKFLTRDELLDLARFVSELGKPGPYAVRQNKTVQRWRLLRQPAAELVADVPHLEHLRQFVLGAPAEAWESAYGQVAGSLPLRELITEDRPKVLILQGELQVSAAGSVDVEVACTEKFQTWVDNEAHESQPRFTSSLEPGRHTITVRVEVSDSPNPELKVELKPAADSPLNFELIGGA